MQINKVLLEKLAEKHEHSKEILNAFSPLLLAQEDLSDKYPIELKDFDKNKFIQGKPVVILKDMPLSADFLKAAAKKITEVVSSSFPNMAESIKELHKKVGKDDKAIDELVRIQFGKKATSFTKWSKKYDLDKTTSSFMALQIAGAAARAAKKSLDKALLEDWSKSYCPVCGEQPQASILRTKEGVRYLHCSMCGHEWRYLRTSCPFCEQNSIENLKLFYLEGQTVERAEACSSCNRYILELDFRQISDELPAEIYLLCMLPLDMIMQEKGFIK